MSNIRSLPMAASLNSALVLLAFGLSACTKEVPTSPTADVNVAIELTESGKFRVLDKDRNPLADCKPCSKDLEAQHGENCRGAPQGLICKGLAGGIVTEIDTYVIIRSKGSYCITVVENGKSKQKCYG